MPEKAGFLAVVHRSRCAQATSIRRPSPPLLWPRDNSAVLRQLDVIHAHVLKLSSLEWSGSGGKIRTYDQAINSRPLYH